MRLASHGHILTPESRCPSSQAPSMAKVGPDEMERAAQAGGSMGLPPAGLDRMAVAYWGVQLAVSVSKGRKPS